jgi:hypothetical protein
MQDSVGVYYSGQDFSLDPPAFFADRETARQWLREDVAWSIHHGRDIALSSEMERGTAGEIDARKLVSDLDRQQSQVMGETVMRANAERERWAVRMTRSWHPRVALAEHLSSLKRYQQRSR